MNPLQSLMLVRLLGAPEGLPTSRVRDDLSPITSARLTKAEWRDTFEQLASQLLESGHLSRQGRGRLLLEPTGRSEALRFLKLSRPPSRLDWRSLKHRAAAAALGLDEAEGGARALRLGVVASQQNVVMRGPKTEAKLNDALAWKALGVQSDRPFHRSAVLSMVLGKLSGSDAPVDPAVAIRTLAAQALGAPQGGAEALRIAALRNFVFPTGNKAVLSAPKQTKAKDLDLVEFAALVLATARAAPASERFGGNKVFISGLWPLLTTAAADPAAFKRRLGEANHRGHLRLSRADLVELMDPQKVAASETHFENAVFHFVRI